MPGPKKRHLEETDWRMRVFDSLSFPTLIMKPNRTIIRVNQIFLRDFAVSLDDVIGKRCHEVFFNSQEPCSDDICPFPKVMATRKGHSILRKRRTANHKDTWEDRVFSPILDDDGELRYVMESIRDVTRVKTLERTLHETREFLEQVVQSSVSAMVAADLSGNILLMNHAAEELIGFTLENMPIGKTIEGIYPPGEAREIMKQLRDEGHGGPGKLLSRKTTILDRNGKEIPVEMTAAIIYDGDHEVATMGIYNDLRGRLAVEKKLKETQALLHQSEKMASLGQLAAGVAHEINNPLTGILFNVSMVMEPLAEEDPRLKKLKCVIEDVHRCKEIVKNLLAYSRQSTPIRNILPLNTVVEQSLGLIRDQKLFGNVALDKDLSEEMILIHADKTQITQVIINLVMNAGAAMDGEGILLLRTYRDKPAKKAFLEVSDTGCGIPEEHLSKIFDPFFTTKEPGKGTGLGLSTSYGIIQENGGHISVKETSPKGTTFLVELPLCVPSDNTGIIY